MHKADDNEKDFWDLGRIIAERNKKLAMNIQKPQEPQIPKKTESHPIPKERSILLSRINDSYVDDKKSENMIYHSEKIDQSSAFASKTSVRQRNKPLILDVDLIPSGGSGRSFCETAKKYFNRDGVETPFVDHYAYSPTYANITLPAFKYYLWWRTNIRNGVAIKTTWSYISLCISELICCDDLVDKNDALRLMWQLLESYSDVTSPFFISDALCKIPEIICDYMLINSLDIPPSVSEDTVLLASSHARLREAFFENTDSRLYARLLIESCSEYSFKKSKFASDIVNDSSISHVDTAMLACIERAVREDLDHPLAGSIKEVTTVSRRSYSNYVYVTPEKLCTITVKFCSVNRSYTLRNSVSGIVKQCENNLRMLGGIKSRLKVFSLEPIFRDTVDDYFKQQFPPEKRKKTVKQKPEVLPEYERLYENERSHVFSLENARRIEERSWSVVEKLVEAAEADTERNAPPVPTDQISTSPDKVPEPVLVPEDQPALQAAPVDDAVSDELTEIISACPECKDFLLAVYDGSRMKIEQAARQLGIPSQVLADTVNAAAFDVIGDILIDIDPSDGTMKILPDYEYIFCE